jgi:hypothetical protein
MTNSDCPKNDHDRDSLVLSPAAHCENEFRSIAAAFTPASRSELLFNTEALFDGGDALKCVIDFFLEARDILDLFSEIVEIAPDRFKFALYTRQLPTEVRDVFLCRHMLNDVAEHFAEFLECRFLCCHMQQV